MSRAPPPRSRTPSAPGSAFRDAKCDYWEKRYEGGTFASVITGDCMRVETARRALEMRAVFDDLDH